MLSRSQFHNRRRSRFRREFAGATVPGTNVLADVAAKNIPADSSTQVVGDAPAFLNGEISDATGGIHLVRQRQGAGWTGIEATGATAAAVRRGQLGRQRERGQQNAEKDPRTD